MFWTVLIPHLTVSAVFVGLLLHALWRYNRRADAIMAKLDRWHAEEMRKYDTARDEIRASMRAQVNAAIAEMQLATQSATDPLLIAPRKPLERVPAESQEPDKRSPNPDRDLSDSPVPTQPIEH